MTFNLAFAVSVLLGVFGAATMWMAQSHNRFQRKAAPIVGLVSQLAWSWYAWLLGPAAGGLWILVALYAAVYARGIWLHWDLGRWWWKHIGSAFLSHDGRCMHCGARLTPVEREFYVVSCERCEGIAMQDLEEAA